MIMNDQYQSNQIYGYYNHGIATWTGNDVINSLFSVYSRFNPLNEISHAFVIDAICAICAMRHKR